MECLKEEYKYLLNDNIPSRLLVTRGEVTYSSFCCFGKAALDVLLVLVPLHIFLVWMAVCHWPEMVTYGPAPHVEKMDN